MTDPEQAMREPTAVFATPEDVAACETLSTGEKVRALVQWTVNARELSCGTRNGNGRGGPGKLLERIEAALAQLDESEWRNHEVPPQRQS